MQRVCYTYSISSYLNKNEFQQLTDRRGFPKNPGLYLLSLSTGDGGISTNNCSLSLIRVVPLVAGVRLRDVESLDVPELRLLS